MEMLIDSKIDLNATDHQGNTILHVVMSDIQREVDFLKRINFGELIIERHIDTAVDIAQLLLDHGSYPHAKNKRGNCPGDQLHDVKLEYFNPETLIDRFKDLLKNYDCSLTLKYLAAVRINQYNIPYRQHLPESLIKFVDLN